MSSKYSLKSESCNAESLILQNIEISSNAKQIFIAFDFIAEIEIDRFNSSVFSIILAEALRLVDC